MWNDRGAKRTDRLRLSEDGVEVFPGAVPDALCAEALDAVLAFVGADMRDPASWRNHACAESFGGLVPLHHPQAFWDVRQHPVVHATFAGAWGTEHLWVTIDRASFRAPGTSPGWLHHDGDDEALRRAPLQGLVYLTDCGPRDGAFQCLPDTFRRARDGLPPDPRHRGRAVHVPGRVGDLVVWHPTLRHGPSTNRGASPRVVQYVGMAPVPRWTMSRSDRIRCWRERMAPEGMRGYPGQREREPGGVPAGLTTLGRRLLGLDRWPGEEAPGE